VQRRHDQNGWSTAGLLRIDQIRAEPPIRGCGCSGYRMAWATHAPRTWDNELSLTFATMAAPNRSTKTASQSNSRQFRSITRLQCYGHIKYQGRFGSGPLARSRWFLEPAEQARLWRCGTDDVAKRMAQEMDRMQRAA
jgi:hypothetical protein